MLENENPLSVHRSSNKHIKMYRNSKNCKQTAKQLQIFIQENIRKEIEKIETDRSVSEGIR